MYPRTIDTADIDSIMISQPERSQFLPVQFRASDNNALGDQFTVNRIPVNVLFVPIRIFLFAEKHSQSQRIFFSRNHQQAITFLQHFIRSRNTDMSVTPQTGNNKLRITQMSYILYAFIENSRIMYLKRCNIGFVRIILLLYFQVFLANQYFTN